MKPLIIIQARLNSTRLPGKVLMPIKGKPVLQYLCERVPAGIVATAGEEFDWQDRRINLQHFQTIAENDVAARFKMMIEAYDQSMDGKPTGTFVRLCGDSPLLDPALINAAIALYEPPYLEIRSPVGSVEVCDTATFLAGLPMMTPHEREHVTLRLRAEGRSLTIGHGPRLVVDEQADFDRVSAVIGKMNRLHTDYGWRECIALRDA